MKSGEPRAIVIAAIITALGTIAAGVIPNWDKISSTLWPPTGYTPGTPTQTFPLQQGTVALSLNVPVNIFDSEGSVVLKAIHPTDPLVGLQLHRKNRRECNESIKKGESLIFEYRQAVYNLTVLEVSIEDQSAMIRVDPQRSNTRPNSRC